MMPHLRVVVKAVAQRGSASLRPLEAHRSSVDEG
jgi:hypothetical protein